MKRKQNLSYKSASSVKEESKFPRETETVVVNLEMSKNPLICHLCLCKAEQSLPLFEDSSKTMLENIKTTFQIEPIQDEAVPDRICTHCIEKINEFIAFQEMVVDNHQKLCLEVEKAKKVVAFELCIEMDEEKSVEKEEKFEEHIATTRDLKETHHSTPSLRPSSTNHFKDDEYDVLLRQYFTFECPRCHQIFPRYRALRQHAVKKHNLTKVPIKCNHEDCYASFRSRPTLIKHLSKHGVVPGTTADQFLQDHLKRDNCMPDPNQKFHCHYCSAFYNEKRELVRHFQLDHGFKRPDRIAKHKCSKCSKRFISKNLLHRHIRVIHERADEVICEICAKVFSGRSSLNYHLRIHTPSSTQVTCPECGKTVKNKAILFSHMKWAHQNQPMTCGICSKILKNRASLKCHIRVNHETPKFKCPQCARAYHTKQKLDEHMSSMHGIGGDLYSCEWCERTFNFSSAKTLHKKTQHPEEWLQSRDETYKWKKKVQQ